MLHAESVHSKTKTDEKMKGAYDHKYDTSRSENVNEITMLKIKLKTMTCSSDVNTGSLHSAVLKLNIT